TQVYSSETSTLSGRPPSNIWTYVTKGEKKSSGHYSATCKCEKFWSIGKPREIESHIANHCPSATKDIKCYYLNLITSRTSSNKRQKTSTSSSKDEDIENSEQELYTEISENIINNNSITEYSNNEYEDQELNNEYEDQELNNEYKDQELDNKELDNEELDNDKSNEKLDIEENNSQSLTKNLNFVNNNQNYKE
ncbi:15182_t:CDS:2, partial [Racocetra fulgida]